MADFLMPALGADMEVGKVAQWLVKPGATVKSGDVVVVVETHKGAIDCEVFLDGVIEDLVPEGTQLPIGGVLAHVRGAQEQPAAAPVVAAPAAVRQPVPAPVHAAAVEPVAAVATVGEATRVRASPAARRRASELGLDLSTLASSAAGAAVVLRDVEAAVAGRPAPARHAVFDADAMREGIAIAMAKSKREIPHYYLARTVDFSTAQAWVDAFNATRPPPQRLLPAVLLLKASAVALTRHPRFNGFWEQGGFRAATGVHVGWAVAMRGGGLVAPAIHDVDRRKLPELMEAMRDLVQRVRAGGLRGSEMADPTVTVTSMGDRGAERVFGVIYPPQVALIGFGAVSLRPWVVDGAVAARTLVDATLAADHRASDGHAGSLLLAAIDEALQHPDEL